MATNKNLKSNQTLRSQIRRQTVGYIVAALGLVAGLAWNDAIKTLIEQLFPLGTGSLPAKFFYATLITVLVVVISYSLLKVKTKN